MDGGPNYVVIKLIGGSSVLTFDVSPQSIDFGAVRFSQTNQAKMTIQNTSLCPILYQCKLEQSTDLIIKVNPMEATIPAKKSRFECQSANSSS